MGWGSPKSSIRPEASQGSGRAIRRWSRSGMRGLIFTSVSIGRPKKYLGITQAPLRVEMKTFSATPLRESSEVMSTALLPIPTTRIRLPVRSSGSVGSM